jgi:hypothetical protein
MSSSEQGSTRTDQEEKNKEFLELVLPLDLVVRKALVPVLFLIGLVSFFYRIPYHMVPLTIILLTFILASEAGFWIMRRGLLPGESAYFMLLVFDCFLVAGAVYYTGGIESLVPTIYAVIGLLAGLTLPLWAILSLTVISVVLYISELWLEAARIIPHISIFPELIRQEQFFSSNYYRVVPLTNVAVAIALIFIAYNVAVFLRKRKDRLAAANSDLDKNLKLLTHRDQELIGLNQKLDGKVQELEQLKAGLEKNVLARTGELEARVKELEEFHDLTVGRELKMSALEKEIDALLQELGREPRYK